MVYGDDMRVRDLNDQEVVELAGDEVLVAAMNLLGAFDRDQELERRRQTGAAEAGDEETRRRLHFEGWRAARRFVASQFGEASGSKRR
jgi:hypothetical protein